MVIGACLCVVGGLCSRDCFAFVMGKACGVFCPVLARRLIKRTPLAITAVLLFDDISKTATNISWQYIVELMNLERMCSDAF